MIEKIFHTNWPWYVSGPLVGLYVLAFLYFKNRPLGASSSFQALLEAVQGKGKSDDFLALNSKVDLPVDPRDPAPRWRVWWLVGLFLGGLTSWGFGGEATGGLNLSGMPEFFHAGTFTLVLILFAGGLLIGVGTRMSGGCTSGHAITGISNMQAPSLYATCVFFAVGMAFSFVMKALLS